MRESHQSDVKHLVSMQYFTDQGRIEALQDLLKGPDDLHEVLPTKLPEINALKADYSDAQLKDDVDDFPAPKMDKPPRRGHGISQPLARLHSCRGHQDCHPAADQAPAESAERPQGYLAHQDNRWWRVAQYDSVVVSNAEGTGASWYQRDPKKLREMLDRERAAALQLLREWDEAQRPVPRRRAAI